MTKQLLPRCCRGSPCLSLLGSLRAAPSPSSGARSFTLLPSPAGHGPGPGIRRGGRGRAEPGRGRLRAAERGWRRAVCADGANGVVKYAPEPTLHANVPRGRCRGHARDELRGSVVELTACPSRLPVRQGRRDSFWTRKRAVPPAPQTSTQHLGQGERLHSGRKRKHLDLNRSFPAFSLLPSQRLSLSPSSCRSGLPCSWAALTSPVSTPPQHPFHHPRSEVGLGTLRDPAASLIYPFAVESPLSK